MTVSKPTLIVLAAGMGSRYGGLKQIDPVGPGGATLLDYSIFDAVRAGFGEVVFVIRRDIEDAFIEGVGARYENAGGVNVRYAFQQLDDLPAGCELPPGREKPWGTAHATLAARELIHGPLAVINADDFYGARAFEMLAAHLQQPGDRYAMVGYRLRDTLSTHGTVTRGVCRTDGDYLLGIDEISGIGRHGEAATYPDDAGEQCRLSGDETVSMNFWGFPASVVSHLQEGLRAFLEKNIDHPTAEYLLPEVIDGLIAAGEVRVTVLPGGGPWFGVTYKEDRDNVVRSVRELIDAGVYPERLWE
jgi:NDP-sugar pyrophosphorylase family protein